MNENEAITKEFFESPAYQAKKAELQKEINSRPREIDYSVFKKNQAEKDRTLELKLKNRFERKRHYGPGYKKFLNTPDKQMEIAQLFTQTNRFFNKTFEGPIRMTF